MATGLPARLTAAEGRRFAWTVGAAFAVLGAVVWWRGAHTAGTALGGLGALLAGAGLVMPGALTPVYRAWMGLAHAISRVTTPLFLGVVYYLVLTPIGVAMRLAGRHPLIGPQDGDSFFVRRPMGAARRSNLTRQF